MFILIRLHVEGGVYDLYSASQQGAIKEPPLHFKDLIHNTHLHMWNIEIIELSSSKYKQFKIKIIIKSVKSIYFKVVENKVLKINRSLSVS